MIWAECFDVTGLALGATGQRTKVPHLPAPVQEGVIITPKLYRIFYRGPHDLAGGIDVGGKA